MGERRMNRGLRSSPKRWAWCSHLQRAWNNGRKDSQPEVVLSGFRMRFSGTIRNQGANATGHLRALGRGHGDIRPKVARARS